MASIRDLKNRVIAWWDFEEASGPLKDSHAGYLLDPAGNVTPSFYGKVGAGGDKYIYMGGDLFAGHGVGWFKDTTKKFQLGNKDFTIFMWAHLSPVLTINDLYWLMGKSNQQFSSPGDNFGQEVNDIAIMYFDNGSGTQIYCAVGDPYDDGGVYRSITPAPAGGPVPICVKYYHKDNVYELQVGDDIPNRKESRNIHFGNRSRSDNPIHLWALTLLAQDSAGVGAKDPAETDETDLGVYSLAFFDQALSVAEVDWLYNNGAVRKYSEVYDIVTDDECADEIRCCKPDDFAYSAIDAAQDDGECSGQIKCCNDDIFAYDAETASADSGECSAQIECCDENPFSYTIADALGGKALDDLGGALPPTCEFTTWAVPASGACVMFPVWVGLFSDDPNVIIFYTLDGSDPDIQERDGTILYVGPFEVENSTIPIRYRAIIPTFCEDTPVKDVVYSSCLPVDMTWLCSLTDKVGSWGVWSANANDDHNWEIKFNQQASKLDVQRLEMYELDENLEWTTGQAWATNTPIYPFPLSPETEFGVYPLQVWEGGSAINSEYRDWFQFLRPANELTNPSEFNSWFKVATTVTSDAANNPYGTTTADFLRETATLAIHYVFQFPPAHADNAIVRFSVWARANGRNWVVLYYTPKSGGAFQRKVWFDLALGKVGTKVLTNRAEITRYDDGWFLCEMWVDVASGASSQLAVIGIANGDGTDFYTGDTSKGLHLWNANLCLEAAVIGEKDWLLYGDIRQAAPQNHFFKLKMFTTQYGPLEAIIPADTCTSPPVICDNIPLVAEPSCEVECNHYVALYWAILPAAAGSDVIIKRWLQCNGELVGTVIYEAFGVASALYEHRDENLPADCSVKYNLQVEYPSGCISSDTQIVTTTICPSVPILTASDYNPTMGDAITIVIRTENHNCTGTIDVDLNGSPWETVNPNLTQFLNPTITDPPFVEGSNVIRVTACNECGQDIKEITITVSPDTAVCSPNWETYNPIAIVNPMGLIDANFSFCTLDPNLYPWWDGRMHNKISPCWWGNNLSKISNTSGFEMVISASVIFWNRIIVNSPFYDGPGWTLSFGCPDSGKWAGYKTTGDSPVGTYTNAGPLNLQPGSPGNYYSSPSTIPASIDVESETV